MKRLLCAILALVLLCFSSAVSETDLLSLTDTDFIHYGDYGLPIGDLHARLHISCLNTDSDQEPCFCDITLDTLLVFQEENGLVPTGYFDSETLRALLRIPASEYESFMQWIPMHGGVKYHKNEGCSGMIEPRQMPLDCAKALGFEACKRCY